MTESFLRPLLFVLAIAAIAACGSLRDEAAQFAGLGPWYEARGWLASNSNPYPLASNRFDSAGAAAAFVDSLYALGADTVYVLNVRKHSGSASREDEPYADALLIRLPEEPQARTALVARVAREVRGEGMEPERDHGQRYLYLWWD